MIYVLDSYFIHRFIIIKYGQVRFRIKSANYYKSYGPFSTSFFAKCLRVGEDGPGRGHLYHTDTFLAFFVVFLHMCYPSLFTLSFGIIDRLCSMIVTYPGHLLY